MGAEGRERQSTKRLGVGMRRGRAAPKQGEWERAGGVGDKEGGREAQDTKYPRDGARRGGVGGGCSS